MYCINCGTKVDNESAAFCFKCGQKLAHADAATQGAQSNNNTPAIEAGVSPVYYCPGCDTTYKGKLGICPKCSGIIKRFASLMECSQWQEANSLRLSNLRLRGKEMHGLLTAWLILIIVLNLIGILLSLEACGSLNTYQMASAGGYIFITVILSIAVIGFTLALFNWKKWGFYGLAASYIFAIIMNFVLGLSWWQNSLSIIGLGVLCILLWTGKPNAWSQME